MLWHPCHVGRAIRRYFHLSLCCNLNSTTTLDRFAMTCVLQSWSTKLTITHEHTDFKRGGDVVLTNCRTQKLKELQSKIRSRGQHVWLSISLHLCVQKQKLLRFQIRYTFTHGSSHTISELSRMLSTWNIMCQKLNTTYIQPNALMIQ